MSPNSRSEILQAALRAQGFDAHPVDVEPLRRMKEEERERDAALIAAGLATAHEIQVKNSFVPEGAVIEVIDRRGSFADRAVERMTAGLNKARESGSLPKVP
jgi:hypothetical protein